MGFGSFFSSNFTFGRAPVSAVGKAGFLTLSFETEAAEIVAEVVLETTEVVEVTDDDDDEEVVPVGLVLVVISSCPTTDEYCCISMTAASNKT